MITYSSALSLSHRRLPLPQEWLKVLEKLFLMTNGRLKHYHSKTVIIGENKGKKNCRNVLIPCLESTKNSSLIYFKVYIRQSWVPKHYILSVLLGWETLLHSGNWACFVVFMFVILSIIGRAKVMQCDEILG